MGHCSIHTKIDLKGMVLWRQLWKAKPILISRLEKKDKKEMRHNFDAVRFKNLSIKKERKVVSISCIFESAGLCMKIVSEHLQMQKFI